MVFLCSLLLVLGCSCCGTDPVQTLTKEIQNETGVDVDDAAEVNNLIIGARAAGAIAKSDKDKADAKEKEAALTVVRYIKCADYVLKGDQASDSRNYKEAAKNYESAARYTDKNLFQSLAYPDSADDEKRRFNIYYKLANSYAAQLPLDSSVESNSPKKVELMRKAAANYVTAAECQSDSVKKAWCYASAAVYQRGAGNSAEAKKLMDEAIKLAPGDAALQNFRKLVVPQQQPR